MLKVYISGKMSGLPEFNYPAFIQKEEELRAKGYEVANPVRIFEGISVDDHPSWEECMKLALKLMMDCNAIYMIDGWENSIGANEELRLAKLLKYQLLS